ncbi:hypothetical protein [Hydrogenimonas sp.]
MATDIETLERQEVAEVDAAKRDFMKKFGKYAATAPLGMYLLMGPGASKAQASGSNCWPYPGHGGFPWPGGNHGGYGGGSGGWPWPGGGNQGGGHHGGGHP